MLLGGAKKARTVGKRKKADRALVEGFRCRIARPTFWAPRTVRLGDFVQAFITIDEAAATVTKSSMQGINDESLGCFVFGEKQHWLADGQIGLDKVETFDSDL